MDTIRIPEKTFFKIGEVAKLLDLESYVLRYWETEFEELKPQKTRSGQRSYQRHDIELLIAIKYLLYEEMYTIAGARRQLKEMKESGLRPSDLVADESERAENDNETLDRLNAAKDRIEELEFIVGALKRDRQELREGLEKAQAEAAQTDLLAIKDAPSPELLEELETLRREAAELEAERETLQSALEAKSRFVAPEALATVQAQLEDEQARVEELLASFEAQSAAGDEVARLEANLQATSQALQAAQDELDSVRYELESERRRLEEFAAQAENATNASTEEVLRLQAKLEEVMKENLELQTTLSTEFVPREAAESLENQLQELTQANADLQGSVDAANAKYAELLHSVDADASSHAALAEAMESASAEVEMLRANLVEAAATSHDLDQLNNELRTTNDDLSAMNENLRAANEELRTSNEGLTAMNAGLLETNEELASMNEELRSTNEGLRSTNEEVRATNDELQASLSEASAMRAELLTALESKDGFVSPVEMDALASELEEARRRNEALLGQLDALGKSHVDAAIVTDMEKVIADLRDSKAALASRFEELEANAVPAEALELAKRRIEQLNAENADLESRLDDAAANAVSAEELGRLRERVAELNIENETLRTNLDDTTRGRREVFANLRRELEGLSHLAEAVH